jgi:hypothetical protein
MSHILMAHLHLAHGVYADATAGAKAEAVCKKLAWGFKLPNKFF